MKKSLRFPPPLLFVLLVASCGGGGGARFVASEDLTVTHSFLFGQWNGLARSNSGGPPIDTLFRLDAPPAESASQGFVGTLVINQAFAGNGVCQAGGSIVRITANAYGGAGDAAYLDLRLVTETEMSGTYRILLPDGRIRDSGNVEISRTSPARALVIRDFSTPNFFLRIISRVRLMACHAYICNLMHGNAYLKRNSDRVNFQCGASEVVWGAEAATE